MPRYIVPVKVGKKRYYAVFSTIVMGFVSKGYENLKEIKKDYPGLRVKRGRPLTGRYLSSGAISVPMKVYRLQVGSGRKSKKKRRRK